MSQWVTSKTVQDRSLLDNPAQPVGLYQRNRFWPTMTTITTTSNRMIGLYAVWPTTSDNFAALNATVSAGNYQVDWGDGTTNSTASNTISYKNFDYNAAALVGTEIPVTLNATADTIERTDHGYANGDKVVLYNITTSTGITTNQEYWVINATANDFQVSTTRSGSAINFTTNGAASLLPFRIAVIDIQPVTGGATLNAVDLNIAHNQSGLVTGYSSGWLDIRVSCGGTFTLPTSNARGTYIENLDLIRIGNTTMNAFVSSNVIQNLQRVFVGRALSVTNMNAAFYTSNNLKEAIIEQVGAVTDCGLMFGSCSSLQYVSWFDTSSVTSMGSMFNNAYSIRRVPAFNTQNVTNMASMFNGCNSLESVPFFNTIKVTDFGATFAECHSLTEIPFFNTVAATSMGSMFSGCRSLISVPDYNTSNVTNMSSMFANCHALKQAPNIDTSKATDVSSMFSACRRIQSVPAYDLTSATTMATMFSNCFSLKSAPSFTTPRNTTLLNTFNLCRSLVTIGWMDTSKVTTMQTTFQDNWSLRTLPLLTTTSVTNFTNCLSNVNGLHEMPAWDLSGATTSANLGGLFSTTKLFRIRATGAKFTHSIANNALSSDDLNEYYTGLPTVVSQTLTVTGNYGTTGDDPTIATGKGWTVTGS